jgi:hypothetical protein
MAAVSNATPTVATSTNTLTVVIARSVATKQSRASAAIIERLLWIASLRSQ